MSKKIQSNRDGIQFPIPSGRKLPSTTQTAKQILKSALQSVDSPYASKLIAEKNWRKNYPVYFQELVKAGIESVDHPIRIAQSGLEAAKASFNFNRAEQNDALSHAMANIKD